MIQITPEITEIIENNPVAFATVGLDGGPHCVAVAEVKVVSDSQILIGDNYMVTTKNNLKKDSRVALVVWNEEREGFRLRGSADYFSDGKWLKMVKEIHKGYPAKGAILVKFSEITKLH